VELHLVELGDVRQQGSPLTPGADESDAVIQLGQTNHVAPTAAPVAVKQVLVGIHHKTRSMIGMQQAQTHEPATGRPSGWLPPLSL